VSHRLLVSIARSFLFPSFRKIFVLFCGISWSMYEEETGCTRDGLSGQDIMLVQQKLVRGEFGAVDGFFN
jgi:hypothetical protein